MTKETKPTFKKIQARKGNIDTGNVTLINEAREEIGFLVCEDWGYPEGVNISRKQAIANAEFIVKAVNHHDDLIRLLKSILPYAESEIECLDVLGRKDDCDVAAREHQEAVAILEEVESILKKAKGEGL